MQGHIGVDQGVSAPSRPARGWASVGYGLALEKGSCDETMGPAKSIDCDTISHERHDLTMALHPSNALRVLLALGLSILPIPAIAAAAREAEPAVPVEEVPATELRLRLARGEITSRAVVTSYLTRIHDMDRSGPRLHAILSINEDALTQAARSDGRGRKRRLEGLPVVVKDNIETADPMPTTAGSLALARNTSRRDAGVIARLRGEGAIVLAKTNLSEWANFRSTNGISGWSAIGGRVRNPYRLDRTACGSSSGTAVAIATSLGAVGLGTETDGSIVCPAAMNGVVGLKPTLGLVSRAGIIPVSSSQDTAGPMGRTVADVAMLFSEIVGSDPRDSSTSGADAHRRDYVRGLSAEALRGIRLGVLRPAMDPRIARRFDEALQVLRNAGAILIEVSPPPTEGLGEAEMTVLATEFKAGVNAYLAKANGGNVPHDLDALIAFNEANRDREMTLFGQELFEAARNAGGLADEAYLKARSASRALATGALDAMLDGAMVAALVEPTEGLPWVASPEQADRSAGPSAGTLPAVAGYPHLTVPMGLADGLPVGLSFIGRPYSDGTLLAYGHAFETAGRLRRKPAYEREATAGE
jgi:amidase